MSKNQIGTYRIIAKCSKTRARASEYTLAHGTADLPTFMPVATRASMKGLLSSQLNEEIILSNTYHCRDIKEDLHKFMNYDGCMLTDSGGLQIVSLRGAKVSEEGVLFPVIENDVTEMVMLTPEDSIRIQNVLGADIIMQLDDVLNPMQPADKIEEGMLRSLRWLDRCIKAHNNANQILFPIIQGGLIEDFRKKSIEGILNSRPLGVAIGGLSGGEDKGDFARIVGYCTSLLPETIPRYVMGVGYPEDVIICIALGADMSDCVYPTRTARFGRALCDEGDLNLAQSKYVLDIKQIEDGCMCFTCSRYTRAFIYNLRGIANFCSLITMHNIFYMRNLTKKIRKSIIEDKFVEFIKCYFYKRYEYEIPSWIKNIFLTMNINL